MPFGLCSASEVFQKKMNDVVRDLSGVKVFVDDILVYGKGDNY